MSRKSNAFDGINLRSDESPRRRYFEINVSTLVGD